MHGGASWNRLGAGEFLGTLEERKILELFHGLLLFLIPSVASERKSPHMQLRHEGFSININWKQQWLDGTQSDGTAIQ